MDKNFRHQLIPQMKVYDNMGFAWLPFIMFTQPPNFRSKVVNTDDKGFRFNFKSQVDKNSVFNLTQEINNILFIGSSSAFGIGATSDDKTISSHLNNNHFNCINLACRAHTGFQEIISLLSNIDKLKKIKKIIIFSGVNDFYISDITQINYPDNFFFNKIFIEKMDRSHLKFIHKFTKFILNLFYPNTLNDKNSYKLNRNNIFDFIKSSEFREQLKRTNKFPQYNLEDKLNKNFLLYKSIQSYFNCEIDFYLQPVLQWSKDMNAEEEKLIEYSNIFFGEHSKRAHRLFNKQNYEYISSLLKNLSKKYDINFYDTNIYFRDIINKNDWNFVDAVHCTDKGYKDIADFIKLNNG